MRQAKRCCRQTLLRMLPRRRIQEVPESFQGASQADGEAAGSFPGITAEVGVNARAARFNVLPPGSVMCGWCEGYEAKARKAEKDAGDRFRLVLRALRQI